MKSQRPFQKKLAIGLVAGLAPALRASRPDLVSDLRGETPAAEAGGRRFTLRDGLVTAQMAVTFVLLVAAGLTMLPGILGAIAQLARGIARRA